MIMDNPMLSEGIPVIVSKNGKKIKSFFANDLAEAEEKFVELCEVNGILLEEKIEDVLDECFIIQKVGKDEISVYIAY